MSKDQGVVFLAAIQMGSPDKEFTVICRNDGQENVRSGDNFASKNVASIMCLMDEMEARQS